MKIIEQIQDSYGNLIKLWGVYENETIIKEGLAFATRKQNKKLIRSFETLQDASDYVNNILKHSK
jgi:hypothetical protein